MAAIDLGTNSIRLLVARFADGERGLRDLVRDMVITRIGQGVDRTGTIAPEPLRRTLTVLQRYCRQARALDAERIHLAATSAVRDASNREMLAQAVERLTGEPMEVLSGKKEAELSFLGATKGLAATAPFLVVDIGGGSTEFALGDTEPKASVSAQIGSATSTPILLRMRSWTGWSWP